MTGVRLAGTQNKWSFGYDANGNLTSVTEPIFPQNPATTYNANGTVATTKDFLGNQTTYLSYDANGLATKIADASDNPMLAARLFGPESAGLRGDVAALDGDDGWVERLKEAVRLAA